MNISIPYHRGFRASGKPGKLMSAVSSQLGDSIKNPFTLSFREDLEETFLDDYYQKSIWHVRMTLLLAIFFYSIFGVLDAWLVPTVKQELWAIRYMIFLPFVSGVFLFSFSHLFKRYMQLCLSAVIVLAGLGIVVMILIAPYPGNYSYYAGLILVFMYGYTYFKLRFIWATLAGWMIVAAYELGAVWLSKAPLPILVNNNFFFLGGNILGMFACYSIELYARKEFIHARLLETEQEKVQASNRELEERVDERTAQLLNANKKLKQEVAERKRAESALKESEQRFRCLGENSPEIIYTLGQDGAFTYVNPAWEKVLGHSVDEVTGKYFVNFSPEEDVKKYVRLFKQIRDGKETLRDISGTLLNKDGSPRLFSLSGAPNLGPDGSVSGMVGLLKDVTEERNLQAQLQQAQKMEAIGTLAGGVAHDFNNLLQAVLGYSDLILLHKTEKDTDQRKILEIKKAGERGAELAQQLLTFSRKVESKLRPTDLNHEVEQVHRLLGRIIPKMIKIELHLAENLKTVSADPAQVEQVLMNLAVNARDAMQEGGKLIIETQNTLLSEHYCRTHLGARPGEYVLLSVSDKGHGMDKETLASIFEPFFTTKETGKGTGLGLSMVYGIVKNHGGYIMCYSEPSEGSTFKIYLPTIEQQVEIQDSKEDEIPIGGNETLLLVDDDEAILGLGSEALSEFGYTVLTASDGENALSLYRESPMKFDLVVLDLIMPGMGGKKCLEELLKINPIAKVVIASGYSFNGHAKEVLKMGASHFISKPYDINQMLKTVRCVLNDEPAAHHGATLHAP
jgi:PAS domain S-box-containing protein